MKTIPTQTATLAGGCFWGLEELLRQIPGVIHTEVGYTGGSLSHPTYDDVCTGRTGHAECVRIEFDPDLLSYENLLVQFFKMHDPTTPHQQGNDRGSQYRSAIFYHAEDQHQTALSVIKRVNASRAWKSAVVTEICPAQEFWRAEEFHQQYLEKNPNGYTCHWIRPVHF